jgi:tetratricopeptide (TPR) repeat protein
MAVALVVVNLVVYLPLIHYDFVSFDDPYYVTENPNVAVGLTVHGLRWAFTTGHAANWHPLTWLSHMLDVQLFGLNAGPHHAVSITFHIINTLAVFALLYKLTGTIGRSSFVAGLFAVHPMHVESVAWISERKDVLSTLLGILTVWAYVGYTRKPRTGAYAAVVILFALGLMAKPMLITLPFVLVLLDIWPLQRIAPHRSAITKSLYEKLPLIGMAAASSVITFMVQLRGGAVSTLDGIPAGIRLENAFVSYLAYIAKMFWPAGLTILYPFPPTIQLWRVAASLGILAALSVFASRQIQHRPYITVGWFWYLGTLLPVIGIVQVGSQSMADRYTYVPLIGLFLIVAWGVSDFASRFGIHRHVLTAASFLTLAACVWVSRQQVTYWHDSMALWSRAIETTTGNYRANTALGSLLQEKGKLDEAAAQYSAALQFKPDFWDAHNRLGVILMDRGNTTEAAAQFQEAIRAKPDFSEAHNNLGNAAARQGKLDEAITHYKDALRFKAENADAHNGLGSVLDDAGKVDEAIAEYKEALRLKPDLAAAHNNMAAVLVKQGKLAEATQYLLTAVRLQPDNADYHLNAAAILQQQGRLVEARQHFESVLKLNPANEAARRQLEAIK